MEVWSELDPELIEDGHGNIKKVVNLDAVRASIENILKTHPGERVMLPEFGSTLYSLLFKNMSDESIQQTLDSLAIAIRLWEDRVRISEMEIYSDPDQNTLYLRILFTIYGYSEVYDMVIPLGGEVQR